MEKASKNDTLCKVKVGFSIDPKIHEDFMEACRKQNLIASKALEVIMSQFLEEIRQYR